MKITEELTVCLDLKDFLISKNPYFQCTTMMNEILISSRHVNASFIIFSHKDNTLFNLK